MHPSLRVWTLLLALLFPIGAIAQTTICVDAAATGNEDGTSWTDAYTTLHDALADPDATGSSASNTEIWIAQGVYTPTDDADIADTNVDTSFTVTGTQDGLEIYGGFQSGDAFADRSPSGHPVVLSGDIEGNDNNKTTDGVTPTGSDIAGSNSDHVLVFDGGNAIGPNVSANVTGATVLDGVTVTGGSAEGSFLEDRGGGLFCDGNDTGNECSPTIRSVIFAGNNADYGGAAVFNDGYSGTSSPTMTHATFSENTAGSEGGAIYNSSGNSGTSSPLITNAIFVGNSASFNGGAILNNGDTGTSSPTITNAAFFGNSAGSVGGALVNVAGSGGTANPIVTNSSLWGNSASDSGDEVFNTSATPAFAHSIVQGSGGSSAWDSSLGADDGGNLDVDPQFVDASNPNGADNRFTTPDDGLQLKGAGFAAPSPGIDAGNNAALPSGLSTDLLGNDRRYEGDGDGTATVDIGAYEYNGAILPVELVRLEARTTGEGTITLSWQTASETGNAGFEIQRRMAETRRGTSQHDEWKPIGRLDGAGTTSEPRSYRFTDTSLPYAADTLRYRLKQIDTDGSTSLSNPVVVARAAVEAVELMGTYPNPAQEQATVRFAIPNGTAAGDVQLRLYDVLGRRVQSVQSAAETGRHTRQIDLSGNTSGMYFLRLQVGRQTRTAKLTIQR